MKECGLDERWTAANPFDAKSFREDFTKHVFLDSLGYLCHSDANAGASTHSTNSIRSW